MRKESELTPKEVIPQDLPKFPYEGFLRKPLGPTNLFSFPISTSRKELYCSACGQNVPVQPGEDPSDRKFTRIGNIQIVNASCGKLLDIFQDAGFMEDDPSEDTSKHISDKVMRAIYHPNYKTSQITLAKIQEVIDKVNETP